MAKGLSVLLATLLRRLGRDSAFPADTSLLDSDLRDILCGDAEVGMGGGGGDSFLSTLRFLDPPLAKKKQNNK